MEKNIWMQLTGIFVVSTLLFTIGGAWDLADSCHRRETECFVCDSNYDRSCGDPFISGLDASRTFSRYQARCAGCCMKVTVTHADGKVDIQRKCTYGMSVEQIRNSINDPYWSNRQESGIISICDDNLCNGSSFTKVSYLTLGSLLIAVFTFIRCQI